MMVLGARSVLIDPRNDPANGLSFYNKGAHPFHRSYVQSVFDSYLREEVAPFIWDNCKSRVAIATMGASFGAYHAAN